MPSNRGRFLPPLVLGLLPFVIFWPVTLVLRVFAAYDVQGYFFPYHVLPAKLVAQGQLPLWNPYVFSGMPLLADGQTAMFYPPNWLFFLLPGPAALNYATLLQFSIAGIGLYLFARALDLWKLPAFIAAVAFMFCGFMTGRVVHLSIMSGVALIPLMLFCVDRMLMSHASASPDRRLTGRWFALSALAIAMQALCGHPQIPAYTVIGVLLYPIVRGAEYALARRSWRPLVQAMLLVVGAYVVGGAVAAVQLVPWAELAKSSVRAAGTDYAWVFGSSTTGAEWLLFFFPFLLGAHGQSLFASAPWDIFQASRSWEHSGYVGILPLALALVAVWHFVELTRTPRSADVSEASSPLRRRWYSLLFLVLLLATGLLLGAGWHTPFSHIVYHVPVLGSFRAVERGLVLGSCALTLLAGFGLQRLVEEPRRQPWLVLVPASLILIVPALFVWAARTSPWRLQSLFAISPYDLGNVSLALPATYVPLLLALASALWLAWWGWRRGGAVMQGIAVALVVLDVGVYAVSYNETANRALFEYQPQMTRVLRGDGEPFRKATFLIMANEVGNRFGQDSLAMSWGMVHGVEDINGFNSLQTRRYTDYVFGARTKDVSYGYLFDTALLRTGNPILNSLNVRYVIVPKSLKIDLGSHLQQMYEDLHLRVYENTQVYPRAYFVDHVKSEMDPRTVFREVTADFFDGLHNAFVETPDAPSVEEPSAIPATAKAVRTSATELRVTTHTGERRLLVVSEMYFPGWRAYVDEEPAPILRTNYLFRGVVVPAGRHVVRFVYRPVSVLAGVAVTSFTLIGLGVLIYRGLRTPHPRTVPALATRSTSHG